MTDEVKFRNWQCRVEQGRDPNGNTSLQLIDKQDGFPVATATMSVAGVKLEPDEVLIKTYSENAPQDGQPGMLETLEQAGIVKRTGEWVKSGFVEVPKCKIMGRGI